jgi:isocitrate/isopropylmalate dehydrogenase
MMPSDSVGGGIFGLFEPIHGTALDFVGKNSANLISQTLSAKMMLWSIRSGSTRRRRPSIARSIVS